MGNPYGEFNYVLNENGRPVRYRMQPSDYGTDVYAGKAAAFIKKTAADGNPFFIYLAVYAPHAPATPAPRHAALFADARAPRTASFNEEDVGDKPAYIRNRRRLGPRALNAIDDLYRKRLQSLQAVDEAVAALVEALRTTGQLERTFIVFASDNGFHMGQHRLQSGKQTPYEEDIHVPLVVRGPGVSANRKVGQLTGNVDLAPTFAEIAGAQIPDFVDGRSLLPLLKGTAPVNWRQAYLIEHWMEEAATAGDETREPVDSDQTPDETEDVAGGARGGRGEGRRGSAAGRGRGGRGGRAGRGVEAPAGIPEYHAVRTAQYTYVEYSTGERELYDVGKDPYELQNITEKAGTTFVQGLSSQLKQLVSCAAASCR
jgi:arylsulfatase A-like enzyme